MIMNHTKLYHPYNVQVEADLCFRCVLKGNIVKKKNKKTKVYSETQRQAFKPEALAWTASSASRRSKRAVTSHLEATKQHRTHCQAHANTQLGLYPCIADHRTGTTQARAEPADRTCIDTTRTRRRAARMMRM